MRIATTFSLVENRNVQGTVARSFERHSRWAKMRRTITPTCFAAELLLSPALLTAVGAVIAPCRETLALALLAVVAHTALANLSVATLRGEALSWCYAPLEIVRVVVMFGCWASAWASSTIVWRGNRLRIGPGSAVVTAPRDRLTQEPSVARPAA